MNNKIIN